MSVTVIEIDFEPEYRANMPPVKRFTGKVEILLPAHHYKLHDLSLGGIIPGGPHIGTDGRAWALKMDLGDEGMSAGDMMEFLARAEPQIRQLWRVVQDELDKTYLLERRKGE